MFPAQANHTTLTQQIAQLTNEGPALPDLGIPMYNWLNDDEHGVRQPHATSFPNGCNLGASWDKVRHGRVHVNGGACRGKRGGLSASQRLTCAHLLVCRPQELLGAVGTAIGVEARGGYAGYVNEGNRGMPIPDNGVGITLYSPNLNVR